MSSLIFHEYESAVGDVPTLEVELDWATDEPTRHERYRWLKVVEVSRHPNTEWPIIRVTGPMEQLAAWLLGEYTGGDHAAAYELLSRAKLPPQYRVIERA